MPEKSIAQFQEGLQADDELRKGLVQTIRTNHPNITEQPTPAVFDAVVKFAAEQGYTLTAGDLESAYKTLVEAQMTEPERELSALELDLVAGGSSAGWGTVSGPSNNSNCV